MAGTDELRRKIRGFLLKTAGRDALRNDEELFTSGRLEISTGPVWTSKILPLRSPSMMIDPGPPPRISSSSWMSRPPATPQSRRAGHKRDGARPTQRVQRGDRPADPRLLPGHPEREARAQADVGDLSESGREVERVVKAVGVCLPQRHQWTTRRVQASILSRHDG